MYPGAATATNPVRSTNRTWLPYPSCSKPMISIPLYGVRRLSLHLGWSQHKARRIRTLAGVRIARPSKKQRYGRSAHAEILAAPNALQRFAVFRDELRPQAGQSYAGMVESGDWVQDFTYLAVVMDLKIRQVVGWRLAFRHTAQLTHAALLEALSKYPPPPFCAATKERNTSATGTNLLVTVTRLPSVAVRMPAPGRTDSWSVSLVVLKASLVASSLTRELKFRLPIRVEMGGIELRLVGHHAVGLMYQVSHQ